MKLKNLTMKQQLSIIGVLSVVVIVFLIGSQSYFHTKEISQLTTRCLEIDGGATIETSFLNLSYSFSCE
ncbi:hypothetical protein [Alkalihalobacterium elongatum]|uniref:hypothetical protein n=1 Tax=Alkalihalobacterium elongatum TaxID=2675466 RepID=UPI001C1FA453|nr:hypothetical protein [Alkalihalobacterium elongatum]